MQEPFGGTRGGWERKRRRGRKGRRGRKRRRGRKEEEFARNFFADNWEAEEAEEAEEAVVGCLIPPSLFSTSSTPLLYSTALLSLYTRGFLSGSFLWLGSILSLQIISTLHPLVPTNIDKARNHPTLLNSAAFCCILMYSVVFYTIVDFDEVRKSVANTQNI